MKEALTPPKTLQHCNTSIPPKKRKKEAKKERGDIYPYGVIYIPP